MIVGQVNGLHAAKRSKFLGDLASEQVIIQPQKIQRLQLSKFLGNWASQMVFKQIDEEEVLQLAQL